MASYRLNARNRHIALVQSTMAGSHALALLMAGRNGKRGYKKQIYFIHRADGARRMLGVV